MNIVLIGPQGSGKGTQAKLISEKYGIPHISTGDIFREIREDDSELGRKVRKLIDSGSLVDDDTTNQIVKQRLKKKDCKNGFILDGYPRNLGQAKYLDGILKINYVVDVEISDKVAVDRLSSRLTCRSCNAVYNTITNPPKKENICDKCNGKLYQRDDDKPGAIKERLKTYHTQTKPLIDYYKNKRVLVEVDGREAIDKVFSDITEKIKA